MPKTFHLSSSQASLTSTESSGLRGARDHLQMARPQMEQESQSPRCQVGRIKLPFLGIKLRRTNYSCASTATNRQNRRRRKGTAAQGTVSMGRRRPQGAHVRARDGGCSPPSLAPCSLQRGSQPQPPGRTPLKALPASPPAAQPGPPLAGSQPPAPEQDKHGQQAAPGPEASPGSRSPQARPHHPPRSKVSRPYLVELLTRRVGKPEPEPSEPCAEAGTELGHPRPHRLKRERSRSGIRRKRWKLRGNPLPPVPSAGQEKPASTPRGGGVKGA